MHLLSCRSIHLTVKNDNSTKDRHWVRLISVIPSSFDVICLTNSTWIHMFQCYNCWTVFEITNNTNGRISITNVIEGQFLTVKLFSGCNGVFRRKSFLVEVCILLRVFTVTHGLLEVIGQSEFFRFAFTHLSCEVFCNQGIISCSVTENLGC